jgi:hypothetical protein
VNEVSRKEKTYRSDMIQPIDDNHTEGQSVRTKLATSQGVCLVFSR